MKIHHSRLSIAVALTAALIVGSCHKKVDTPSPRVIQYVLYTDQDYSNNFDTIRFRLYMGSGIKTIFDSSIAPMTIAAIPDSAHALVFRKTVPAEYAQSQLAVDFFYEIDNVGASWFLDSAAAGQNKTVRYNFY